MKYIVYFKSGETDSYNDPDDVCKECFEASDDFHAYVIMFAYFFCRVCPFDELELNDEVKFNEYVNGLKKLLNADEITEELLCKFLTNLSLAREVFGRSFYYNDWSEIYWVKRNRRIIMRFNEPSVRKAPSDSEASEIV